MIDIVISDSAGNDVPYDDERFQLQEFQRYNVQAVVVDEIGGDEGRHQYSIRVCVEGVELPSETANSFTLLTPLACGEMTLQLEANGERGSRLLSVEANPEKLTAALWADMLEEIELWVPGISVGTEGPRGGDVTLDGIEAQPLFLSEALWPLVPAFSAALEAIVRDPRTSPQEAWENVRPHEIRLANGEVLRWIGRRPSVREWFQPWSESQLEGKEPLIPRRRVDMVVNHPVNRYLSWLVARVIQRLRDTSHTLNQLGKVENSDSAKWCSARAARLLAGANAIEAVRLKSWLRTVRMEPVSESALLVIIDEPAYARAHALGRRLLTPRFRLNAGIDTLRAPVRPSFTLYELWCFLAVQRHLAEALPSWRWDSAGMEALLSLVGSGTGARYSARSPEGWVLSLEFNPIFSGYHVRGKSPRWSLSTERRPDIVVTLKSPEREGVWVCLDAKYRAGLQNIGKALASAHIYRDSLRYEGYGGQCKSVALLCPAVPTELCHWFLRDFRQQFGIGALELKPGTAVHESPFAGWILSVLDAPASG